MSTSKTNPRSIAPAKSIRRFDVFAEYNRLDALRDGRSENEAKGHGIWLAKVVASRQRRSSDDGDRAPVDKKKPKHPEAPPQFKSVGDELQTNVTFDHDIIERMGVDFYQKVFAPAIKEAFESGETYEQIRDTIRADWNARS